MYLFIFSPPPPKGFTGLVVSVIATVRGSQSSSHLQRGPSLPALVSLRRSSDLSKVISQSFGPQGDSRRRWGSEWRWSNAEHRDPRPQSHVQSAARVFSQVASYPHTDSHRHTQTRTPTTLSCPGVRRRIECPLS